jgi:regulator of protease activity HflC (stomatin/prohibitin superfamily)
MIWIVFLLVLVALVAVLVAVFNREDEANFGRGWCRAVAGFLSMVLFIFACAVVVKDGHVGVPVTFGVTSNKTIESGLHSSTRFASVEQMSVRTENYWMSHDHSEGNTPRDDSVSVRSSNGLQMPVDLSVPYRLIPDTAPWVYRNLGKDYVEKILR